MLAKIVQATQWGPRLVAADMQRPAAIDQLKIIGEQLGVPVHSEPPGTNAVKVGQNGVAAAPKLAHIDVVILDTARRRPLQARLMPEPEPNDPKPSPHDALLVD